VLLVEQNLGNLRFFSGYGACVRLHSLSFPLDHVIELSKHPKGISVMRVASKI
jgi:hypothetical protein